MRFTVSVPDDLWVSAVEAADVASPSAVVQLALGRFVAERPDDGRLQPDFALRRRARALGKELAASARADFDRGYEAGLAFAESVAYADIQAIHQDRYDLTTWVERSPRRFFDLKHPDDDWGHDFDTAIASEPLNQFGDLMVRYGGVDARKVANSPSTFRDLYDDNGGQGMDYDEKEFKDWIEKATALLLPASQPPDSPSAQLGFIQAIRDIWDAGAPISTDEEDS
jgi:hypothetical protein